MNVALKPPGQELVITRDLKVPPARVFAAWTDERQSSVWWVPKDCTLVSCEMDVRVGGAWRRRMRVPDGTVITKHGIYRQIVPPGADGEGRLVFTYNSVFADGRTDPQTLVTLTFAGLPEGGSRLTLRHSGFWDDTSRTSHIGGWTGVAERLDAFFSA